MLRQALKLFAGQMTPVFDSARLEFWAPLSGSPPKKQPARIDGLGPGIITPMPSPQFPAAAVGDKQIAVHHAFNGITGQGPQAGTCVPNDGDL